MFPHCEEQLIYPKQLCCLDYKRKFHTKFMPISKGKANPLRFYHFISAYLSLNFDLSQVQV